MNKVNQVALLTGFVIGVFADDFITSVKEAYTKLAARKTVLTAEQIQKNFVEDRLRRMGDIE